MKQRLYDFLTQKKMINTHSHHMSDEQHKTMDLHEVLARSYTAWIAKPPTCKEEVDEYLLRYGANSYWRWLVASLKELYGLTLSTETFDQLNDLIVEMHKENSPHITWLKEKCGYEKIILDYDFAPGSDIGHPDLFVPVLRCNMFAICNTEHVNDCNGHNSFQFNHWDYTDFSEYLDAIYSLMSGFKGIKFAIAYEIDNEITNFDKKKGARAFRNPHATPSEIKDFYDYVVYAISKEAEKKGIVIQIHTGLGFMNKTAPIYLKKLIDACPNAKFLLLHGGFPWSDDMLAFLHNYRNVWVDLSWMPLISPTHTKRFLIEALEVGDSHRFTIGCDTYTAEESYGAVLACREVLSSALGTMVNEGSITLSHAFYLAERIWSENARELFSL